MLIKPQTAIQEQWVQFPSWMDDNFKTKCIQPNAIDITADRISRICPGVEQNAHLSETNKQFHPLIECQPDPDGYVDILPNTAYDIHSDFFVNIPNGVAGELIIRSTLNRAGLALNAGMYDSGYTGHLGMVLYNRTTGLFRLKLHTRVCQLKLVRSDMSDELYSGGYNHTVGSHWSEKH